MKTLSVITVVRNNLPGLSRTVSSLGQQDAGVFEHIVIDGASTDGTPEYLAGHRPAHPFRYISEPDEGLYHAMNKGVRLAEGRVVLFLNSGDVLATERILGDVADSWCSDNWRWAFGGIRYVDGSGRPLGEHLGPRSRRAVELGQSYFPHPAAFVDRELLLADGFHPEFGLSADQELLIRMAKISTPHLFPFVLTLMEAGGIHSSSSAFMRARRYHAIRARHNSLVAGRDWIDNCYTIGQGSLAQLRSEVRRRLLGRSDH